MGATLRSLSGKEWNRAWVGRQRCAAVGALLRRSEGASTLKLGQRYVALEAGDDRGRAVCSLEGI